MGRILFGTSDSFHALARLAGMAFENVDYKSLDIPAAPFSDPSIIPDFPKNKVPRHIGVIMDGNGRWAQQRGLIRTDGHQAAEPVVFDTIAGAIEAGVRYLSLYTFSTENWKRSPQEVRFLMGFSRDIIHRRVEQMNAWGVRVRCSPEVRITKSQSGISGLYRCSEIIFSVTRSPEILPSRTSFAIAAQASAISARPP